MFHTPEVITKWLGSDPVDGFILKEVGPEHQTIAVIARYRSKFHGRIIEQRYVVVDTTQEQRMPSQGTLDTLAERVKPLHYDQLDFQVASA